jgi:protein involved in polysaccharide export with SLBB domain
MRNQSVRSSVNLYDFLLRGKLELIQLNDGDTIIVEPRKKAVTVSGEVLNPYIFEYDQPLFTVADLLKLAGIKPTATHVSIVRRTGRERTSEYYEIAKAQQVILDDGDEVRVLADRYSGTILVRVEGSHVGEHALVLPYGATLKQVFDKISPSSSSNLEAIQLFRKSVANRQKEMINTSLTALETQALTARSATVDEVNLRGKEAEMILQFVERARHVEPKGQVILTGSQKILEATILEDGDTIVIPEKNSLLLVSGEVMFPNAIVHTPGATPEFYIKQAGGYAQNADNSRILLFKTNGVVLNIPNDYKEIVAGDELMVLPKVDVKRLEIAKGFTQIIYQIAIATRTLFLF